MVLACSAMLIPGFVFAQATLHIDGNTTETAASGTTAFGTVVAGFNSGTVGGVPGGTFIVPAGANVVLSGLHIGQSTGSTGLVTVNGGTITTTNPQSQYYIGFNGSGTLTVSDGGTVVSNSQSYVGYNPGSSGILTVDGHGSSYTNTGFFVVGNGGPAQLNVTHGGAVSSPGGTLQIGAGSTATALVSGDGSILSAGTFLGVGVSAGSVGTLTISDGGMATSGSGTYLAFNGASGGAAPSAGTIVVSNGGLLTSPLLVVGTSGTADMQIQSNGIVTISGKTIVGAFEGASSMEVSGPGATLNVQNNDLIVGGQGNGTITVSNQGTVSVTGSGGTFIAGQCGAGLTSFCGNSPVQGGAGTVTVTDSGSVLNAGTALTVGQYGPGMLTIEKGARVVANSVSIAENVGSTGTLNIGAAAGAVPVAPGTLNTGILTFGSGTGTLVFNHTDTSGNYAFPAAITGTGTVNVLRGETVMTGASTYAGPTTIAGGTLAAGAANVFSANSDYIVQSGATMDLRGFDQHVASVVNAGLIRVSGDPGTVAIANNYVGQNGTIALDTFLAGDNSPSDKLILDGGTATGATRLAIANAGGPGALTLTDGIPVVETINGGTTDQEKFTLAGEVRGGAFDYFLFRGGAAGSEPEDWFLRSDMVVGPEGEKEEPAIPNDEVLPLDPPPSVLPPGEYPIIGPEIATYSVVQPLARQLGLTMLGTMHERIGDTLTDAGGGTSSAGIAHSAWVRVFGQQVDNRYQTYTDARANGQMLAMQAGLDVWRGSFIPGHHDAAGVYFAYGNGYVDVDGLVTNADATAYVLSHTGKVNLNAYSGGAYWTHFGPGGWYIDAVLQGTHYDGDATTKYARLPISGSGFATSLETGYPFSLPLGPGFVLEPQAQIIWQHVGLSEENDGLGSVDPGSTSGVTGRLGVRGQWTIEGTNGQVWQPYVRANLWRDWGARATTTYSGVDQVPLAQQSTRMDFAAGVTEKATSHLSLYGQFGYRFSINGSASGSRKGVWGDVGGRYVW
ncbi:autotransporter outer membrane beta-barrel domain-containing protein [Paraburkholderia sp. J8-2]|uniref:autotransporter outer membrane beta-barrel domain-containing protein n=1 Tax=Paraburkholderia sp. J8-2 TaxID=2805440 RepID=UPI002AB70EEF|nr:autotransporter outer membrane beta-barrel domain-containing protein [Paraburkholderia sp. J8-2]